MNSSILSCASLTYEDSVVDPLLYRDSSENLQHQPYHKLIRHDGFDRILQYRATNLRAENAYFSVPIVPRVVGTWAFGSRRVVARE